MIPKTLRPGYCKQQVHNLGATVTFHQCRFKVKRDGYCGIHHPDAEAARERKARIRWTAKRKRDPLVMALAQIKELQAEVRKLKSLLGKPTIVKGGK